LRVGGKGECEVIQTFLFAKKNAVLQLDKTKKNQDRHIQPKGESEPRRIVIDKDGQKKGGGKNTPE